MLVGVLLPAALIALPPTGLQPAEAVTAYGASPTKGATAAEPAGSDESSDAAPPPSSAAPTVAVAPSTAPSVEPSALPEATPGEPPLDSRPVPSDEATAEVADDAEEAEPAKPQAMALRAVQLQCGPGYVYGVRANGQILQITPGGAVTNIGSPASGATSFNGLGMGAGGSAVYGYERSSGGGEGQVSRASVHRYNPATEQWTNTGHVINSNTGGRTVQFVGGAVSLQNSRYYVGGFSSDGRNFRLWEYDPATNSSVYKGQLNTSAGASTGSNGDFAFDALGNLFIVRGVASTSTVFSITAEDLAAASGGIIPGSQSNSVTTMSNVNGVAFDSDGRAFLGAGADLRSYAMPNFTNRLDVTASLNSSTDLASCGSPPTITIEKVVEGERVKDEDQFHLTLTQGNSTVGQTTTTGSEPGLQAERVGPLPAVRGVPLRFTETAAGGTNLNDYATSYRCEVDGVLDPQASGEGRTGTVTIPASGESVVCRFHNAPLLSSVDITKTVLDYDGADPQPGTGWTVGAASIATTGTVAAAPAAATQQTNGQGHADWELRFGTAASRATVTVSETQQPGYAFVRGTCEVASLDGSSRTVELTSEAGTAVPGVAPGDQVECHYVNKVAGAELTLQKDLETRFDPAAGTEQWVLAASGPTSGISGVTGDAAVTAVDAAPGRYTLSETLAVDYESKASGYEAVSLVCTDGESGTISSVSLSDPNLTVEPGTSVTCVFTNRDLPGSAEWLKTDGGTGDALAGSEWMLTGPRSPDGVALTGDDAGNFLVGDLIWGDYELRETKAPTGYKLSEEVHHLTVGPAGSNGLSVDLGALKNDPQDPLTIPLTGGIGSIPYWLVGGLLAVLALAIAAWKSRRGVGAIPRE